MARRRGSQRNETERNGKKRNETESSGTLGDRPGICKALAVNGFPVSRRESGFGGTGYAGQATRTKRGNGFLGCPPHSALRTQHSQLGTRHQAPGNGGSVRHHGEKGGTERNETERNGKFRKVPERNGTFRDRPEIRKSMRHNAFPVSQRANVVADAATTAPA